MKLTINISFEGRRKIEIDALPSDTDTVAYVISMVRLQEEIDHDMELNLFDCSKLLDKTKKLENVAMVLCGTGLHSRCLLLLLHRTGTDPDEAQCHVERQKNNRPRCQWFRRRGHDHE